MMRRQLKQLYNLHGHPERSFARRIARICGQPPVDLALYQLAFTHRSSLQDDNCRVTDCNERLEYLGDAALGTAVSELLFKRYPNRDEGYLTDMRSKVVSRKSLNAIGQRIGLDELLIYDRRNNLHNPTLLGNTLEALVGALYLDHGPQGVKQFLHDKILDVHIDLDELEQINENYKSQLMEFVQKHKMAPVRYELVEERVEEQVKIFKVAVRVGSEVMGLGLGNRKKAAEQEASAKALRQLQAPQPPEEAPSSLPQLELQHQ